MRKINLTITEHRVNQDKNQYIFVGKTELYIRDDKASGVYDDGMSDEPYPPHINILKADNAFF